MVEPFGVDRIADHEREIRVIKRMIMDLEERFRATPGGADVEEQARLHQDMESLKQLVDQLSSREGVTLHRLETLKERIDEVVAVGQGLEEMKRRLANSPKGVPMDLTAEAVAALREEFQEVRQGLDVLRAAQAAQAKRLDALKEESAKLRSGFSQLEAQAHGAMDSLQQREAQLEERVGRVEKAGPPASPAAPRRPPVSRSRLDSLRERAAQVGEVSDSPDSGEGAPPRRGGKGRAQAEAGEA